MKALFLLLVFLSFLSFANLGLDLWRIVLSVLAIALFATCYQFKRWAIPQVRFRDLGSDLKQGFSELKKEIMTVPLKKNSPKRKKK